MGADPRSAGASVPEADPLTQWFKQAFLGEAALPFGELLAQLAIAFGLGLMVAGVYYLSSRKDSRRADRSMLATLVLLCVLIALVTLVIGTNLARAFGMVGTLAIVRFRTVVDDTRDTAFVIFSVAAGMAAGSGYVLAALVCAPFVLVAGWLFRPPAEKPVAAPGLLVLRMGAGRPPGDELLRAIKNHAPDGRLIGMATVRGGSALDLTYAIRLPEPDKVFALVSALGRVEGVQAVEVKES
jgi:hypothetical protein